jgi:hypothetical protein
MSSAVDYIIGSELASREGADERFRQVAGVLTYTMGLTPLALVTTIMLARREAEASAVPAATNGYGLVPVPETAGLTTAKASEAVKAAGLAVSTTKVVQPSPTVDKDRVIGTQPAADVRVKPGTEVVLVISSGGPGPA